MYYTHMVMCTVADLEGGNPHGAKEPPLWAGSSTKKY